MSRSVPAPRPVHPCLLSVFDGNTGAEYSTWAHITTNKDELPNLVTAQGSTLRIYTIDDASCTLIVTHSFTDLAGTVCFLQNLSVDGDHPDALLIGFCGHPRLAIAHVVLAANNRTELSTQPTVLEATTLIDLTQALTERCMGSVTPLEQDLIATLEQKGSNVATLSVILGGGIAVAAMTLRFVHGHSASGWTASEPYLLPLVTLQRSLERESLEGTTQAASNLNQSILAHGFGDITAACFLTGYLEPTVVLLHSNRDHGRTWPGRLGRPNGEGGTKYGMVVTALSLTVAHRRSAVLWSVEVPADALSLWPVAEKGCLVVSINTILHITNSGRISSVLAVNGWAKSTCPSSLLEKLQPNPWPLPRLAVQLDGAQLSFTSNQVALLSLRNGQLYLLQQLGDIWSMVPLGKTLGAIGQISSLLTLSLANVPKAMVQKLVDDREKEALLSMGLVFAGSRLGDSLLLGYTLEGNVTFMENVKEEPGKKPKIESDVEIMTKEEDGSPVPQSMDEYEVILRREEEALYAPVDGEDTNLEGLSDVPDIIPPSSDEETEQVTVQGTSVVTKRRSRPRLVKLTLARSLNLLDTITSLGPIGPGCEGPLSKAPTTSTPTTAATGQKEVSPLGASVRIFPCGYGSSGSLALVTVPGRDDRSILAEADCLNVQCIFSLPLRGLVLLGMGENNASKVSALRVQHFGASVGSVKTESGSSQDGVELSEVDLEDWCSVDDSNKEGVFDNPSIVLREMTLLSAVDFDDDTFAVLVMSGGTTNEDAAVYGFVVLEERDGKLHTVRSHVLANENLGTLCSATPIIQHEHSGERLVSFGCTWSSGIASLCTAGSNGSFETHTIDCVDISEKHENEDESEEQYYQNDRIHAIDVFVAPKATFASDAAASSNGPASEKEPMNGIVSTEYEFDDDDVELYRDSYDARSSGKTTSAEKTKLQASVATGDKKVAAEDSDESAVEAILHVAVCRQSGLLQVFTLSNETKPTVSSSPMWESQGCGQGASVLSQEQASHRLPRMHKVHASELRFFATGPTFHSGSEVSAERVRTFNLIVETSDGDLLCYENSKAAPRFCRVPLHNVARQSIEENRHHTKLVRKRIVGKTGANLELSRFRFNRLHSFTGISGQDGLFAATARPLWFISERGALAVLSHQCRHVAPSGGKPVPVAGFCVGLQRDEVDRGFLTLHERIGRVGSQRLTVFRGIANILSPHGLFPGGGLCVEKVPLGVTVRAIQFINDSSVSSGSHPLFALLISREIEADHSNLNDDGLTPEGRQLKKEAEEAEKVKRQVEADLGGFDLAQEWVEEIEREDCFEIDMPLGGAPPIKKRAYALWVVDASNNWNVVDSYEFEEFEHGMTMEVMSLTEVNEEPGNAASSTIEDHEATNTLFVAVGTSVVDKDGEDVNSKGRVLLFQVERESSASSSFGSPVADLSLTYEKNILHGGVTSLSCLSSEGRNRLVIGAGADVNVEQWGLNRLTQVGFFRANMQILNILLFRNFFLLSDAYDSLYFLVWRESDKSLTLLAKDYEPIPVFAAGVMSRGGSMTFVCHDDRQNLQFFQYAPGDPAARGGNKLVPRADMHLGSQTVGLHSYFCRSSLLVNSATSTSTLAALKQQDSLFGRADDDQRLGVHFGSSDGGMGSIVPLSEPVYWRFVGLQSVITNALDSNCSLSHRAWRLYRRTPRRGGCRSNDRKKSVIDGDMVMQFADLPLPDQEDLASAIGSTVELVLDNLLELKCASMIV